MVSRSLLLSVAAVLVAGACRESTGPRGPSVQDVTLFQVVPGKLEAGDTAFYRLRSASALGVAAQVLVQQGGVSLYVTDSAGDALVPSVTGLAPDTCWKGSAYAHMAPGSLLKVGVIAGSAGAAYQVQLIGVQEGPETHSAVLVADDTVDDEFLDDPNDIDVFTFAPQPGNEYVFFAQGPTKDVGLIPAVDIFRSDWLNMPGTYTLELDPADFEANRLYLAHAPVTYSFRVRQAKLTGTVANPWPVPYRLVVKKINYAPEHVPALLTSNDTVSGEAIDHVGDVDDFKFYAAAGDEFNLSFQSLSSSYGTAFWVGWIRGADTVPLLDGVQQDTFHVTGRFAMPGPDTFRLRISAPDGYAGLPRGPYRFQLYRINHAPEDVSQTTFALGGGITGESIDVLGDVDEFTMTVPADTFAAVYLWEPGASARLNDVNKAVQALIIDPSTGKTIANPTAPYGGTDSVASTGMMRLKAGTYRVRVFGTRSQPPAFTGPYSIASAAFDTLPENRPALLALGDTAVDSVNPREDEDHYRIPLQAGQPVNVCLSYAGPAEGTYSVDVFAPQVWPWYQVSFWAPAPGSPQCQYQTRRFTPALDGVYSIVVHSNGGGVPDRHGPYRLAALPYPVTPETAPADVRPGDSVTTEKMDEPGDVDEFHLMAPPGTVFQTWIANYTNGMLQVQALYSGTVDTLKTWATYYPVTVFGRVTVPASGQVNLRFFEQRSTGDYGILNGLGVVGPYTFWTRAVNRSPESVPAAIAIGDTIQGEKLDYEGDIDEFTFADTAGDSVQTYLQFPNGYIGIPGVRLDVVAPDGTVLGTVSGWNPTDHLEDMTTGRFRLPVTGTYTVRVQAVNDRQEASVGAYRFQVAH